MMNTAIHTMQEVETMPLGYVMKVSANGQVSIPAEVRARWNTERVAIADMGDYIVIGPMSENPLDELVGKYPGRGPSTDEMRRMDREEDARYEARREARG